MANLKIIIIKRRKLASNPADASEVVGKLLLDISIKKLSEQVGSNVVGLNGDKIATQTVAKSNEIIMTNSKKK